MALNIKDPEADRLARELAAKTGETLAETVIEALRQGLRREAAKAPLSLKDKTMAISQRSARLPRRSGRTPDEIVDYDKHGAPG